MRSIRRASILGLQRICDQVSEKLVEVLRRDEVHAKSGADDRLRRPAKVGNDLSQRQMNNPVHLIGLNNNIDVLGTLSAVTDGDVVSIKQHALTGYLHNIDLSRQGVIAHSPSLSDVNQGSEFTSYLPNKQGEGK